MPDDIAAGDDLVDKFRKGVLGNIRRQGAGTDSILGRRQQLGHLTQHSPKAQELEERMRDVDARSFRGRQVTWSPSAPIAGEQVLVHRLGRVPSGFWLVAGDLPLVPWATPAQRARWTRDKLYFYMPTSGPVQSGIATLTGSSQDISFARPLEHADAFVLFGTTATAIVANMTSMRVAIYLDADGNTTTAPPYWGFRAAVVSGVTPASAMDYAWEAHDLVDTDSEWVFQVY